MFNFEIGLFCSIACPPTIYDTFIFDFKGYEAQLLEIALKEKFIYISKKC